MSDSVLSLQDGFPEILRKEAETILKVPLELNERFTSADSFSYLLKSDDDRFVGKIYRFKHWPPEGKLEVIYDLLDKNGIPHEEVVYSIPSHPVFKFGWQINKFIPGGSIREVRKSGNFNDRDYYFKLGKILSKIHTIKLGHFGFLSSSSPKYPSFKQFTLKELHDHDYHDLPPQFSYAYEIISKAKDVVTASLDELNQCSPVLVHDDANDGNVMWNMGNPILIDWTDSLAAPSEREFACLTFRQDSPVLEQIEQGYGVSVNRKALRIHQLIRFIRLGQFYYLEDGDINELKKMMERLAALLSRLEPYGV